jgi:hypothetical protein
LGVADQLSGKSVRNYQLAALNGKRRRKEICGLCKKGSGRKEEEGEWKQQQQQQPAATEADFRRRKDSQMKNRSI